MKFGIIAAAILIIIGAWYVLQPTNEVVTDDMTTDEVVVDEMDNDPAMDDMDQVPPVEESNVVDVSTDPAPEEEGDEDMTMDVEADMEADASVDTEVDTAPAEVAFTVDSFNFGYSMEEIRVNEGDVVTINLTNSEGFHDWVVDEFAAATEKIQAGDTTSVTFVADKAGTYEYYCSVGSHRAQGMVGTLIVE